jgi:RNA polymerase sigma-70 factor (ECF subfamily)
MTIEVHDAIKAAARRDRDAPFEGLTELEYQAVDDRPQPETLWEQAETAEAVWAALGRLAPEQRAAVVARYYLGLNQAEMTSALGCPPSTVKWRLHAARARLRVLLTPLMAND